MAKIHYLFALLTGLFCFGEAEAEYVTPQEALARVYNDDAARHVRGMTNTVRNATLTSTIGSLYLFNSATGFMILPDDNRAPALLAYSDSAPLEVDGIPALAAWLNFYNKELGKLKEAEADGMPRFEPARQRAAREPIAPLIKTEWNQESPYNMLCPKVNGHDVVTGCVATAMAQFMKYYNYPAKGKGTHSYYWEVGKDTLSLDYDTIPFQWTQMTDTYNSGSTELSKEAVAQLMVACGISVDMHYDIGDSGAATSRMGLSLINIFDYSPSLWMAHRDYYGYDEWIGMIYDELAAGRPVLYSGQGTAGGHQFICDGFQGDGYFHFNWGWGGLSNGYFLLTALNPDDLGVGGGAGGFNTDQIATLNGRPAQTGDEPTYLVYNSGGFTPDTTSVKTGDDLRCGDIYFNYSMAELPDGSVLGMKFENADTKAAEYVRGPEVGGMHLDQGRYYDVVKFPELTDGTYYITPALHANDKWSSVRMPLGTPDMITAVVKDGIATLSTEADASVNIQDVEIPDTIFAAHDCPLHFTAFNSGDLEYYANVTPYLISGDGTAVGSSAYRPMDVLPEASEDVSDYVANFTALSGQTLGAGDYSLVFRNAAGDDISSPVKIYVDTTSVATSIKVSDFHLETANPVTDPTKVDFGFSISCETGVYYNCPRVLIFPGAGGYDEASLSGAKHYLVAGETSPATVSGSLENLKDGDYMAAVYDDGEKQSDFVRFELKRVVSAVEELNAAESESDKPVYDLHGILRTAPLLPGIYVTDGHLLIVR